MTAGERQQLLARIGDRRVVASVSGGKDSAAMSLYLRELGIEHDRVFMDTGWEHPATYEYLRGDLTAALGAITEIRGAYDFVGLVRKRRIFPSRIMRFCTQELKVRPMQRHLAALVDAGADVLNAVGIRRAESAARAQMAEWEWSDGFDCEVWRPLVKWTERDVIEIHQRHGLRPNPLYLRGATRVGCWPCIHARKSEIALVERIDPERIETITALERELTEAGDARAAALGRDLDNGRTMFWLRDPGSTTHRPATIHETLAWARSAQVEMFPDLNDGCMRWGLCETGGDE